MRACLFAALLLAACHDAATAPDDLAVAAADDLAVAQDLGAPRDLAGPDLAGVSAAFCAALRDAVDGGVPANCAVALFASFMTCFRPSGVCTGQSTGGASCCCLENGANVVFVRLFEDTDYHFSFQGRVCGRAKGIDLYAIHREGSYSGPSEDADAGEPPAGEYDGTFFTCPNGDKIAVGDNLGGCPELNALLDVNFTCVPRDMQACP